MRKNKNIEVLMNFIDLLNQEYRQRLIKDLMDLNFQDVYPITVSSKTNENLQTLAEIYNRINMIIENTVEKFQKEEFDQQWTTHRCLQIIGLLTLLSEYQIQILELEGIDIDQVLSQNSIVKMVMNILEYPLYDEMEQEKANIQEKIKTYEKILKQGIQNLER